MILLYYLLYLYMILQSYDDLNVYCYGSRVYNTHSSESDNDYIVVRNQKEDRIDNISINGNDYTFYSIDGFKKAIREHEISVLECLFLPKDKVLKKTINFNLDLDKRLLRHSISQKASNSWVKAKKKLIVDKDYEPYIGKKSLFHSLRIILFGIQIAEKGYIYNYEIANKYLNDILNEENNWDVLKNKYQKIRNGHMTEFKKLAPK